MCLRLESRVTPCMHEQPTLSKIINVLLSTRKTITVQYEHTQVKIAPSMHEKNERRLLKGPGPSYPQTMALGLFAHLACGDLRDCWPWNGLSLMISVFVVQNTG